MAPVIATADAVPDPGIDAIVSSVRYSSRFTERDPSAVSVHIIKKHDWSNYLDKQPTSVKNWLGTNGPPSSPTAVPNFEAADGSIGCYVATLGEKLPQLWSVAAVLAALPRGRTYNIAGEQIVAGETLELAWGLAWYAFGRYKSEEKGGLEAPVLVRKTEPGSRQRADVDRSLGATYMVRDMITTPAEDFGPANMEAAVSTLGAKHAAKTSSIVGEQLLRLGYPQVHRVGRAAGRERAPRLLELVWNEGREKKIVLVGKGVCYDTGGLSIKPTKSMVTMNKDMGGAATVLGLADMIMDAGIDVTLRVLIPAVENNVDAASYRPGDVLTARNGLTTLNMNSDAEGRLILADALVAATEDKPDLIVDCATLTGAQRVALGPDIPSIFCTSDDVAGKLEAVSRKVEDLVWRLPLYAPYKKMLDTPLADIKSCSSGGYGGAITAALYLKEFVGDSNWVHVDMMGYNVSSSPGRPEGGEAMGMRTLFEFLRERYS